MAGVFQKIKSFLVGTNPIEVYGGNKGGYAYIIFYDPKSKEVLNQYITPPKQQSRNIGAGVGIASPGLTGNVNYQSEESFGETFLVSNNSSKLKIDNDNLLAKYNEDQQEKITQPNVSYDLPGDKSFLAGAYMAPVSTDNAECPDFQAHFPFPDPRVDNLLAMWPEFVIKAFWPEDKIFRSSIFLHDAVKKELKIHAAYNMTGEVDLTLGLPETAGAVGLAFANKTPIIWDGAVISHKQYGVDPTFVWADMESILAVPILDGNNFSMGALSIDSDKTYVAAHFDDKNLNKSLMILARSIGRLLESTAR